MALSAPPLIGFRVPSFPFCDGAPSWMNACFTGSVYESRDNAGVDDYYASLIHALQALSLSLSACAAMALFGLSVVLVHSSHMIAVACRPPSFDHSLPHPTPLQRPTKSLGFVVIQISTDCVLGSRSLVGCDVIIVCRIVMNWECPILLAVEDSLHSLPCRVWFYIRMHYICCTAYAPSCAPQGTMQRSYSDLHSYSLELPCTQLLVVMKEKAAATRCWCCWPSGQPPHSLSAMIHEYSIPSPLAGDTSSLPPLAAAAAAASGVCSAEKEVGRACLRW